MRRVAFSLQFIYSSWGIFAMVEFQQFVAVTLYFLVPL